MSNLTDAEANEIRQRIRKHVERSGSTVTWTAMAYKLVQYLDAQIERLQALQDDADERRRVDL